jgi:hypothetical protein
MCILPVSQRAASFSPPEFGHDEPSGSSWSPREHSLLSVHQHSHGESSAGVPVRPSLLPD